MIIMDGSEVGAFQRTARWIMTLSSSPNLPEMQECVRLFCAISDFNSAGDAYLLERMVPGIEVYGGIFLNSDIGGINPTAVDTAMTYATGARFVCMATDNSAHGARAGRN